MEYDIQTPDGKVKLAQPITEMEFLIYEIMAFTEALPIKEQQKIYRFVTKQAINCGWLKTAFNLNIMPSLF